MTAKDIRAAILNLELTGQELESIVVAVRFVQENAARHRFLDMKPGDKARIKLPMNFRPRYLDGQEVVVRKKNIKKVVVDLVHPTESGRFDRGLTIDPEHLVPV